MYVLHQCFVSVDARSHVDLLAIPARISSLTDSSVWFFLYQPVKVLVFHRIWCVLHHLLELVNSSSFFCALCLLKLNRQSGYLLTAADADSVGLIYEKRLSGWCAKDWMKPDFQGAYKWHRTPGGPVFSSTATLILSMVHKKKTSPAKGLLISCQDRGEAQYFISVLDSIWALLFEHSSVVFQNLSAEPPWIHQCFFGTSGWSPRGCQRLLLDVGVFWFYETVDNENSSLRFLD